MNGVSQQTNTCQVRLPVLPHAGGLQPKADHGTVLGDTLLEMRVLQG